MKIVKEHELHSLAHNWSGKLKEHLKNNMLVF